MKINIHKLPLGTNDIVELKDKIYELQARVASMLDTIVEKNKEISDLKTELRTADAIIVMR